MEPLKPFTFYEVGMYTHYNTEAVKEVSIMHKGKVVGVISEYPPDTHGKAPVRVMLFVYVCGVLTRHHLRNKFYTIDEAKEWCLSKQLSMFDQYALVYGE